MAAPISRGFQRSVDELRDLSGNSRRYIAEIERASAPAPASPRSSAVCNNIFGFYIEISKSNQHLALPTTSAKQTLVNADGTPRRS